MNQESASTQARLGKMALAAPSFAVSLVTTELFFKWGSFMLELAGFAALWSALYAVQGFVAGSFRRRN